MGTPLPGTEVRIVDGNNEVNVIWNSHNYIIHNHAIYISLKFT